MTERLLWGAMWRSENKLDGKNRHLISRDLLPVLFLTRKEARKFIKSEYGYIKTRKDLRVEPHGWRLPVPIRVKVISMEDK
jgi:hypothetical protein